MAEDAQALAASSQAPEASADSSAAVKDSTPVYEVGFHIVPTVGEDGVGAVVEAVRKAIAAPSKENSVEFIAEGYPQKMTLAYVIERATAGKREKYTESYFGWIKFALAATGEDGQATPTRESIPALEAKLLGMKEVMRSLIIQTVREDIATQPRRAVFASDRLEGETIKKAPRTEEKGGEVSEADLDKSIEALTGDNK